MRYLSHSQISMYERCPWSWYASYVLKYSRESNPNFAEGGAVHAALASHWLGNKDWREVLKSNLEWKFKDIELQNIPSFGSIQKSRSAALDSIRGRDEHLIVGMTECLKEKFGSIETIEVERRWRKKGFIAVVDWRGKLNEVEYILDWKTSNKPYDEKRVHKDQQLTAYAAVTGVRHVGFGVMVKSDGSVQFLASARTKDECEEYWKKVEYTRDLMDAEGPYAPCTEGWYCKWCSFQNGCPAKGDF